MRAMFIDPGALRTELVLEQCSTLPDGLGGHAETWTEIATVFALVEPVTTQAVFGADQTLETITHRVTIRWRGDTASGMRFNRNGRLLVIVTVHDPDESARYLICRTREKGL